MAEVSIVVERPTETNNPTSSRNSQTSAALYNHQFYNLIPDDILIDSFPVIDVELAISDHLTDMVNYQRSDSNDGFDDPIPRRFPSGSSRPTVALDVESAISDDLTDMDNYQRSDSNDGFDDPIPRRFPSGSSRPTVALDVESAISDDLNVPVDQPAEINNQRPFMSMSNVYQLLGSTMNTGSAVNLLILALFAFTEIKSQGDTEFPFQTHPHITRVAIDSMPLYGLLFLAEHVISAAGPGPDSVYASIARAGRKLCLCILVASLASLFYF